MDKKTDHRLENYRYPDKFGQWLGYQVVRLDHELHVAETELHIREDHLSPAKKVHGGVVSAFLDYTCGAATFTTLGPKDYCSTVELKVNYLRPINLGDHLRAECRVVFKGKRLCVLHGFVYRKDQPEPLAMATATFNIIHVEKA